MAADLVPARTDGLADAGGLSVPPCYEDVSGGEARRHGWSVKSGGTSFVPRPRPHSPAHLRGHLCPVFAAPDQRPREPPVQPRGPSERTLLGRHELGRGVREGADARLCAQCELGSWPMARHPSAGAPTWVPRRTQKRCSVTSAGHSRLSNKGSRFAEIQHRRRTAAGLGVPTPTRCCLHGGGRSGSERLLAVDTDAHTPPPPLPPLLPPQQPQSKGAKETCRGP